MTRQRTVSFFSISLRVASSSSPIVSFIAFSALGLFSVIFVLWSCSWTKLGPAGSRHYSDVDLRLGESCGLGRDYDIAVHSQFAAPSVGVAADGSYDRLRYLLQAIPKGELVLLDQDYRSRLG